MTDKIVIPCSECGSNLAVPSAAAGKKVRCPKCKTLVDIPGGTATGQHRSPQSASQTDSEPRRARRVSEPAPFERPAPPTRRRPKEPAVPTEDEWLDDGASSYDEVGSEWDSYGTPDQLPQALPPRKKRAGVVSQKPTLRGTGNEPPSPYERPREAVAKASNSSIIAGILMMVGAAVWFFGGLAVGIIFFYPPFLFVFGFVALVKGVLRSE